MKTSLSEECRVFGAPETIHYIPDFISEEEERQLLHHVYAAPKPRWTQLAHRRLQNWGGLPHPKGMVPESLPSWLDSVIDKVSSLGCFGEGDKYRPNHVLVNEYLPGQGILPHMDGPLFTPIITTLTLGSHVLLDLYTPRKDGLLASNYNDDGDDTNSAGKMTQGNHRSSASNPSSKNAADSNNHKVETRRLPSECTSGHGEEPSDIERIRPIGSVLLERRSLVVVRGAAYESTLHGIAEVSEDTVTPSVLNPRRRMLGDVLKRETRVSVTIRHVPKVLKLRLRL